MYIMNEPTIPGQNSKGENAAIRVSVAAITGPAMRWLAIAKASRLSIPSPIRRSANSVTMMASSTSIPTARISENSTTMFTVSPASDSPRMPIRNEAGIANPISSEARPDSAKRMTMNTRITAVSTEFCKSDSSWRMLIDLSWLKVTTVPGGSRFWLLATSAFTASTVSIRFAPVRFETSMAMAGLPFSRVIEVGSFCVAVMVARSRARTTAVPVETMGRFATSSGVSISEGSLME